MGIPGGHCFLVRELNPDAAEVESEMMEIFKDGRISHS